MVMRVLVISKKESFLLLIVILVCLISSVSSLSLENDPLKMILGQQNLAPWHNGKVADIEAPGPSNDPTELLLAANRTRRPDILRGFKRYRDGWNITNRHYWASVGFTGAAGFILAALWFIFFGLALVVHHCCGWKMCMDKKDNFHSEVLHTLNYVVNQSEYTVDTLRNVTYYLSLAKNISVAQIFLPSDVMDSIDKLNVDLNNAADKLTEKTSENDAKIRKVFNAAISVDRGGGRDARIDFARSLALYSWSPTCNSYIHSVRLVISCRHILPLWSFLDLQQSKQVTTDIVNVINQFIYTYANTYPSEGATNYYNQSGPSMPPLCYPFDGQLQMRECTVIEVSMENASSVWQNYTCKVAESGICTTVGRVTPQMYEQLVGAVTEGYALKHYTPPLLSLQNCEFVRDTFQNITSRYCPPLIHYLKIVNAGLGLISVGVLLCLVLWMLYANRPQREEAFAKFSLPIKVNLKNFKNIVIRSGTATEV
ncbi:hypothetical protein ACFE04_019115 [Oxalis oulophora]